nr:hypothetical protein [Rhodococcus sp. HNM0569]
MLQGLCDDAALFPPGNAPMTDAVPAHSAHRAGALSPLVGPFIVPESRLTELAECAPGALDLSITFPQGPAAIGAALDRAGEIDGVQVVALEIASAAGQSADEFVSAVTGFGERLHGLDIFVEIPRDERRPTFVDAVADAGWYAKFRTGGVQAQAYPDEAELAAAIHRVVAAGVPFKATAGLHHAVRNTDPTTGFEQHGFVNLLLATRDALAGATPAALVPVLAERDGQALAGRLRELGEPEVAELRRAFRSYGTCSIAEPVADLAALGLLELDRELASTLEGHAS